ncbi:MAG: hypothetical protein IPO43_22035 [Rhodoferax sp.]|nr:hypothetical protein [Rhodoferax sp.]
MQSMSRSRWDTLSRENAITTCPNGAASGVGSAMRALEQVVDPELGRLHRLHQQIGIALQLALRRRPQSTATGAGAGGQLEAAALSRRISARLGDQGGAHIGLTRMAPPTIACRLALLALNRPNSLAAAICRIGARAR